MMQKLDRHPTETHSNPQELVGSLLLPLAVTLKLTLDSLTATLDVPPEQLSDYQRDLDTHVVPLMVNLQENLIVYHQT